MKIYSIPLALGYIVVLAGCTKQSNIYPINDPDIITSQVTGIQTIITGDNDGILHNNDLDDLALPHRQIFEKYKSGWWIDTNAVITNNTLSGVQRKPGEEGLHIEDNLWIGTYHNDRNFALLASIDSQTTWLGYHDGFIYIDMTNTIVRFPVDRDSFRSYYTLRPSVSGEIAELSMNTGTNMLQYEICRNTTNDSTSIATTNLLQCFAEDRSYIYARKPYPGSKGGYELLRISKWQ